jgi:hypothetical protein
MKVGLHIADFTWQDGPPGLGRRLGEVARRAEDAGIDRLSGERVEQTIEHLHELAELGFEVAHGSLAGVGTMRPPDLVAERVVPAIEKL